MSFVRAYLLHSDLSASEAEGFDRTFQRPVKKKVSFPFLSEFLTRLSSADLTARTHAEIRAAECPSTMTANVPTASSMMNSLTR